MTLKQLAAHWGLKEDSAERWVEDGTVPKEFITKFSRRYYQIDPACIPLLEQKFSDAHLPRVQPGTGPSAGAEP